MKTTGNERMVETKTVINHIIYITEKNVFCPRLIFLIIKLLGLIITQELHINEKKKCKNAK